MTVWLRTWLPRWRCELSVALLAAWLILVDVGTPLLVTGGAPYGETHLLSTWAFTLHQMSVRPIGALIGSGSAIGATAIGFLLWLIVSRSEKNSTLSSREAAPLPRVAAAIAVTVVAVPIAIALVVTLSTPAATIWNGPWLIRYLRWALLSVMMLVLSTATAAGIARIAFEAARQSPRWLAGIPMAAGMGAASIWYWWLSAELENNDIALQIIAFIIVTGISAGLIVLSLSLLRASISRQPRFLPVSTVVTLLMAAPLFALDILFAQNSGAYSIATGLSLTLAGNANAQPIALVLCAVTFALVYATVYALRGERESARANTPRRVNPPLLRRWNKVRFFVLFRH